MLRPLKEAAQAPGTRIHIEGLRHAATSKAACHWHGTGTYIGWSRCLVGPNDHLLRFDGPAGTDLDRVRLKLKQTKWKVV